jgi:ABC-type Na+ efflux pump permease subunit
MYDPRLIVARKEIRENLRDVRSLASSALYVLMGPLVVLLVSFGIQPGQAGSGGGVLFGMMSVFALVAAFVGGVNVAMDSIAGERERRSLLPLLLNPVPRRDILVGKWIATGVFSAAGLAINMAAFAAVFAVSRMAFGIPPVALLCLLPLALFAAALELLISTTCRSAKEAHTYLSLLVLLPMGVGMFLVFYPHMIRDWWFVLPIASVIRLNVITCSHDTG